jgi:hypothetical protein
MGKSILEEAVEDVQALKRAAEENAKNLLVEAMSPRIKQFIQSHLGQEGAEAVAFDGDAAVAGDNLKAPMSHHDEGENDDSPADESDMYEIEDEDDTEDELELGPDEDEDEESEEAEGDEEEEEEEEELPPVKKPKLGEAADSEEDEEEDEEMEESVEITSEDLKKAFLSSLKSELKTGKFGDPQDPNDGEYGLAHKVPGETMWADGGKVVRKSKNAKMVTKEQHNKVVHNLYRQLAQYHEAFKYLKKNLNEMNLFNAKLIYTTKLLQNNLSNKQKLAVVEKLDKARTKREVEFMYNTLSESFKIAGVLGEGQAKVKGPKASRMMQPGSTLTEGRTQESAQSTRWAELAGLTD